MQIVVADDCSTDDTAPVCDAYQARYPHIFTLLRPATGNGAPSIKNLAVRHCTGDYVALHDAAAAAARRWAEPWRRNVPAENLEFIFVHCHAQPEMLDYLRELAVSVQARAVLQSPGQPFVMSHDANRAARRQRGKYPVL